MYTKNDFIRYAMVNGSEILSAYDKETFNVEKRDEELVDYDRLKTYPGCTPPLDHKEYTQGGPLYVSVGQHHVMNMTNNTVS